LATSEQNEDKNAVLIDPAAMFKLSYGLFLLTAKDGSKDNGCIINTVIQITSTPVRISIALNKANYTHEMIVKTGEFNISVLTEGTPFSVFERFGFSSGRDKDKFEGCECNERSADEVRTANGLRYAPKYSNCVISAKVIDSNDYGTHTVFVADVTQSIVLSNERSLTYQYYFDNIKPKSQPQKKKGFICKICNYIYEGDSLPDDYICPLCKHGIQDFEPL
jgi:flavin reductase (DIM6/NTAB) family NADH-FMN oxidoreductase RutF